METQTQEMIILFTEKRSTKIGAALLVFALMLRLFTGEAHVLSEPNLSRMLLYLETGRVIRLPQISPQPTETEPEPTEAPAPEIPVFLSEDMAYIDVMYASDFGYRPNLEGLLQKSLSWDLQSQEPTVLIVHTHGSESYTKTWDQNYKESASYRTLDCGYNMVAVGDRLQELLEEAGIHVIHDRTLHDYPSYNDSYENSRSAAKEYLKQYPSIQMVLDLHRDAALNSDGTQYATHATVGGVSAAQIMLVVGSNATGLNHPNWQDNLATALKLHALLEQSCPGITRPLVLRAQRFNHDLAPGAMIVEIGTAGNTLAQAMAAVPVLAQAIIALAHGANLEDMV